MFAGPNCPKIASCECSLNNSWYVTFDSDEDAQKAYRYLREEVREFKGHPIMARIKAKPMNRTNQYNTPKSNVANSGYRQPTNVVTSPGQAAQLTPVSPPANMSHNSSMISSQGSPGVGPGGSPGSQSSGGGGGGGNGPQMQANYPTPSVSMNNMSGMPGAINIVSPQQAQSMQNSQVANLVLSIKTLRVSHKMSPHFNLFYLHEDIFGTHYT